MFEDRELYLLRNMSKGRGVGFFEAGNFHPDFIVWLIAGGKQYISFVDPKGIRNLGPKTRRFSSTEHQGHRRRLGDPSVILNSFIVSNTPSHVMQLLWAVEKAKMNARHILFQQEDKDHYVDMLLTKALACVNASAKGTVSA